MNGIRRGQGSGIRRARVGLLWLVLPVAAAAALPDAVERKVDEIQRLRREAKYEEAITLGRSALAEVESEYGAESIEVAQVAIQLASSLAAGGKAGDAETLQLAERGVAILRIADDPFSLANGLLGLGTLQWRRADYDSARRSLSESIDVATGAFGAEDLLVASGVENLGILLWTTGEYGEARDLLERTLRIRQAQLDPGDNLIGRTLNNLAILHYQMGDYLQARRMYERSLEIREQTLGPDHPETADVIDNLALVLQEQGDDAQARALFERALAVRERALGPDHPFVAISLVNIGEVLRKTGELDRALQVLERAVAVNDKAYDGKHRRLATALEGQAGVLLGLGRADEARQAAERALGLREEIAPGDVRVADTLSLLSRAREAGGDLPAALRLRERSVEVAESSLGREHAMVARKVNDLALLQMQTGQLDLARNNFERSLSILDAALGPDHPDVALALSPLARVRWEQGDLDRALSEARRAGRVQDGALRATVKSLPEQQALYLISRSVEPEVVLFSGLLGDGAGQREWLAACWDWTLRRRGLVFEELARRQRAALVSGSPEALAAWERVTEARRRLAALWIRGPGDGDPAKYRKLFAGAVEAKASAEAELARTTLAPRAAPPPGREEVRRTLPRDSVLVEVVRVETMPPRSRQRESQDVALLLFGDGRMAFAPLGPSARIDALVEGWRAALDSEMDRIATGEMAPEVLDGSRRAGIALRQAIWDPIASKIGDSGSVFLVPDGALHRVDLRALPREDGGFLVESGPPIHLLSTGRDLVRFTREPASSGRGMLALGAPDFGADPGERLTASLRFRESPPACVDLRAHRWPSLPESGLEVEEIAGLAPPDLRVQAATGDAASEELFRREAPGREKLHLATHGFFVPEDCGNGRGDSETAGPATLPAGPGRNPLLLSGLVLAGAERTGEDGFDDGILTAEEIAGLDLTGVRLAVLSACDTGGGQIAIGEGVFGLRRALEIAGVRTVVMSLWRVPDRPSRRWMRTFYASLFAHGAPGDAARRASLEALSQLRQREQPAHPYLWSGFVTVGDWR